MAMLTAQRTGVIVSRPGRRTAWLNASMARTLAVRIGPSIEIARLTASAPTNKTYIAVRKAKNAIDQRHKRSASNFVRSSVTHAMANKAGTHISTYRP